MEWSERKLQEPSADVRDSVQYLRRYLDDDDGAAERQRTTLPHGVNTPCARATGVLPNSITGWKLGEGQPSESLARTPYDRQSACYKGSIYTGQSPTLDSGRFDRPLSSSAALRRVESRASQMGERRPSGDYSTSRASTSPFREPLRLHYGSVTQTAVGRPPLVQQRQEQQQQQQREPITMQKGGYLSVSCPRAEDASPRSEDTKARGMWTRASHVGSDNHQTRSHIDPYGDRHLFGNENSHNHHQRHGRRSPVQEELVYSDHGDGRTEEADRRGYVWSGVDNSLTSTGGRESRSQHPANDHSSGGGVTAGSVGGVNPNGRQPATKGQLPSPKQDNRVDGCSQGVFPYAAHDDNLRSMLFYLKNQYALDAEESRRGIETMTPEDVLALAQCFYVDAYRTVRRARDLADVGRAGFTDRDPNTAYVAGDQGGYSEYNAREKEDEGAGNGTLPNMPPLRKTKPPKNASPPPPLPSLPPSPPPPPLQQQQQHLSLVHSTHDRSTATVHSATTSPLHERHSGILRRPLKGLMPMLRRGSTLCKHVGGGGRPHLRFFCIEDYSTFYKGEEVIMPHFTWSSTPADSRVTMALNLPTLISVHLLSAADADQFRKLFRHRNGIVVDHNKRPVTENMCAVFRFEERSVAVSFLTEDDRQLWVGGMMSIVERNILMTAQNT